MWQKHVTQKKSCTCSTFEVKSVPDGNYTLSVWGLEHEACVKSIRFGSDDVFEKGMRVESGSSSVKLDVGISSEGAQLVRYSWGSAFEAVLADLQQTSPDLILHGGDLADAGASPVEIVDRIRDLGWPGVVGNTDELIFRHESLEEFANQSSAPASLWTAIREMATTIRSMLGEEKIAGYAGFRGFTFKIRWL
jgi:hypothetical protein